MSAAQHVVSFTGKNFPTRFFISGSILSGGLEAGLTDVLMPIESPGVDGRLFRRMNKQAPPLVMELVEPTNSYANLESIYSRIIGQKITVRFTTTSSFRVFSGATAFAYEIRGREFEVAGFGETGQPLSLRSLWVIERPVEGS